MKKTFYEVLEVSENASPEIIEKAYRVLAKKYHPDLQASGNKKQAEEKMKEINQAYDVLGNVEKRQEYDETIRLKREQEEAERQNSYGQVVNNESYKDVNSADVQYRNNEFNKERQEYESRLQKEEKIQRQKMQENLNKEYQNAYESYLRSLGYKVKHKITKKNIKDIIIVIIIMAIIITALWFIPPTHDWMVNFYEENTILKTFIDIIVAIVTGIFKGIWEFITSLFDG